MKIGRATAPYGSDSGVNEGVIGVASMTPLLCCASFGTHGFGRCGSAVCLLLLQGGKLGKFDPWDFAQAALDFRARA